jgi:hypothetical protein
MFQRMQDFAIRMAQDGAGDGEDGDTLMEYMRSELIDMALEEDERCWGENDDDEPTLVPAAEKDVDEAVTVGMVWFYDIQDEMRHVHPALESDTFGGGFY